MSTLLHRSKKKKKKMIYSDIQIKQYVNKMVPPEQSITIGGGGGGMDVSCGNKLNIL